jgi:HD-like signal output (HDOD) protein
MSTDVIKARIMTVMRNLPPLPEVTRQLMSILNNENASANDVAKVLSSDQALAGKVLKLVNSSFYGVPKEVTTITRAVVILGFTGIRNLALGFGSVDALRKLGGGMDMNEFWSHALANGAACQALVPFLKRRVDPEEAFIAGLMHDIGAYVLATAVPDIYRPIIEDREGDRLAREAEEVGLTHAQVGQGLLQFWQLPDPFCDAARYHHDVAKATDGERPLTNLVALADVMACIHGGSFENGASEADLLTLMRGLGVSLENIKTALKTMDQKIEEMESFMRIAGADAAARSGADVGAPRRCVVVTTEDERREWAIALLTHFGHEIFPMDDYFNQVAGCEKVGLVLIDTQCLTQQQVTQLMPFLSGQSAQAAVLLESGAHAPVGTEDLPRLSIVFSRSDVARVLDLQKV